MSVYSAALERVVAKGARHIELIYTSHSTWPLIPASLKSQDVGDDDNVIPLSVLDSSFNPPTNAHLALARLSHPGSQTISSVAQGPFAAKLLLYSMKNADKTPKVGDATPSQRLEMMILLAKELQRLGATDSDIGSRNIAVALCQEPTFVGKSAALKHFFQERVASLGSKKEVQLTFLLGYDTLERLFAPRYYGTEETMKEALRGLLTASGDGSRVLCARRSAGASYSQAENDILEKAAEYIESGAVAVTDIGEMDRALSSSEVRQEIQEDSSNWETKVPAPVAAYIREHHLYHAE
ncbi:hypothetical protein M422DRAFT_244669 [Sphaerobolus stellatus SS14]|nr:hypothetical protein M422DRAFT_244669 [Sphaerobolus stellatus SS14]